MMIFKWVNILLWGKPAERKAVREAVMDAVETYKKGKISKQGREALKFIKSKKVDFIGFAPDVRYIMENSNDKDNLEVIWDHKFSIPALLYHIKDSPFLLLVNPNVEYNNSKLKEIDGNEYVKELEKILGITG